MKNNSQFYIINFQSEITGQLCPQYALHRKSDRLVLNSCLSTAILNKVKFIKSRIREPIFYFILLVLVIFSTVKRALIKADLLCLKKEKVFYIL